MGEQRITDQVGDAGVSSSARVLVTGGFGCIGVQTVRWLLESTDASVVSAARTFTPERIVRAFGAKTSGRLRFVTLDVRDQRRIESLLIDENITHVIHLGALQTPDCNADRDAGLQINVAGTQNLIEAVRRRRPDLNRLVFASSVAVYGPRAAYPDGRVPMNAAPAPVNVYGVWKLAGELISGLFSRETGIPTVCLRPGALFGPGRDAGLTASPTTAMKHLVFGKPYEIPFCNRQDYLFSPDVGAAFGLAATAPFSGFGVFTLPSHTVNTDELISKMRMAAAGLGLSSPFGITAGTMEVPFICDLDFQPFMTAFPSAPKTPLDAAIRQSLEFFMAQRQRGWLQI